MQMRLLRIRVGALGLGERRNAIATPMVFWHALGMSFLPVAIAGTRLPDVVYIGYGRR